MSLEEETVGIIERNSPVSNVAILAEIEGELASLNRLTEHEFLAMGGKLHGFIEIVDQISSDLAAIADLISGEQGAQASKALSIALDFSTGMRVSVDQGNELMAEIRQQANRLRRTLALFHGTASTFHSLGLLTRIETVRLGSAGQDFGNLAEDVRLLARNIQSRVESALDTAEQLTPRIEAALRELAALQRGQAKELPLAISQVSTNLASFQELQQKSRAASIRLGAEYQKISEAFKSLIVSIQFHDITRQQIEHVSEVLERLCAAQPEGTLRLLDLPGAATVLELQSSQLADALEKFCASTASVAASLDQVSSNVVEMMSEKRELAGLSASGNGSSFLEMEHGCNTALASLGHCTRAQAATRTSGGGLVAKIAGVQESIEEIRKIEAQMQQTAMNARISAGHLGNEGDALSTLADEIKHRAFESREGSDALLQTLKAMGKIAACIAKHGATGEGRDADEGCLDGMRNAVENLRASYEGGLQRIEQVTARGNRLCQELDQIHANFSVGTLFAEAVNRVQVKLQAVIASAKATCHDSETPDIGLAAFITHYTVKSERDVYEAAKKASDGSAVLKAHESPGLHAPHKTQSLDHDVVFF